MINPTLSMTTCYQIDLPEEYYDTKDAIIISYLEEWRDKHYPGWKVINSYGEFYLIG